MDRKAIIDAVLFNLTGGVVHCELDEKSMNILIDNSLRELQAYISTPKIITIPYQPCIDMKPYNVSSVTAVYRARAGFASGANMNGVEYVDPMYAAQWQILAGTGSLQNFQGYMDNYAAYQTILQLRNTIGTDLAFYYDVVKEQLTINVTAGIPDYISIEFLPHYKSVEEIVSDYWIDKLIRLATANGKIALGRIRTRYSSSSPLMQMDGETMLAEGNQELQQLREEMDRNQLTSYPMD